MTGNRVFGISVRLKIWCPNQYRLREGLDANFRQTSRVFDAMVSIQDVVSKKKGIAVNAAI
jgi:hypothetical protein